jgi:outer membrane receptor protein involved in Fe transport
MRFNFASITLYLALLVLMRGYAFAQEALSIVGVVTNADNGLPVLNCHVSLMDTPYGTVSDDLGRFTFYLIPAGQYSLNISHVTFQSEQRRVYVPLAGEPISINIQLKPKRLNLPEVSVESTALPSQGRFSGARVIDRSEIRGSNAENIGQVLEREGLATVTSDGSPGGAQTVSIRGSASNQVLVLLDGQPLNDVADGIADLSRISLLEVQQIEVYPEAPASLGAQAIGGAINIVTIDPGLDHYHVQAGLSEFGDMSAAFSIGRDIGGWPAFALLEHRESTGAYRYHVVPDDGLNLYTRDVGSTFTRTNAAYRRDYISLKIDPPGILAMGARHTELHRQNPDYLPLPALEHESTTDDSRRELTLNVAGGSMWYRPEIHLKLEGYQQSSVTDYGTQYPLLYSRADLKGETYNLGFDWHRSVTHWEELHFGGGFDFERLWSTELTGGYAKRSHEYGFLQVQGDPLESLDLPVRAGIFSGVRADLYTGDEAFVHPRLGVELGGGDAVVWSCRGELTGAYRLPSFNSLFWVEDLQSAGNPNLKPERSQNRELSGRLEINPLVFTVSYFDRDVWDLIYWRLDFDNRWRPLNISKSKTYGSEVGVALTTGPRAFAREIHLSYRWTRALNYSGETNTDGKLLPYKPEHTGTLVLRQNLSFLEVDLSSHWVSTRYTNEANTKSLVPYNVWNLGLSKQIGIHNPGTTLTLRLEIKNFFNEEYRLVDTAPTSLRQICFSLAADYN